MDAGGLQRLGFMTQPRPTLKIVFDCYTSCLKRKHRGARANRAQSQAESVLRTGMSPEPTHLADADRRPCAPWRVIRARRALNREARVLQLDAPSGVR